MLPFELLTPIILFLITTIYYYYYYVYSYKEPVILNINLSTETKQTTVSNLFKKINFITQKFPLS